MQEINANKAYQNNKTEKQKKEIQGNISMCFLLVRQCIYTAVSWHWTFYVNCIRVPLFIINIKHI